MRIEIVIPSEAFKRSGGVRLRYQRFIDAAADGSLHLRVIDEIDGTADAYIFSKTYQSAAPAIAYGLAARGKPVILDLYDDYFSSDATRMQRFRRWLNDMGRAVHHVTVSTDALAQRVGARLGVPVSVIADPAPAICAAELAATLEERARRCDPRRLRLVWFGVASNPYFEAGLCDLARAAPALAKLGRTHTLTIVTNLSGSSDAALSALSSLPFRTDFVDWSVGAERHCLAAADVVVLPVSDEPFQTAKSTNRAVTALAAGAQVLSLGAPIYATLDPFIYRHAPSLSADMRGETLRFSPKRVDALCAALSVDASASEGAERLVALASSITPDPRRPHAVVVGSTDHANLFSLSGAEIVRTRFAPPLATPSSPPGDIAAPPLRDHGVLDLRTMRTEIDAHVKALSAPSDAPAVFVAHNPVLAP